MAEKYGSYSEIAKADESAEFFKPRGKIGYAPGHGERRRAAIRMFAKEQAGTLAKSRMAEVERQQTGQTKRTRLQQAGALARTKLGVSGAGGFTSSQTANLRKSAYESADKEIERRRELGELGFGKGKNRVDMTQDQVSELRESLFGGYFKDYTGGGMQQPGQKAESTGFGTLSTAGGRRFDVLGDTITERKRTPAPETLTGAASPLQKSTATPQTTGVTSRDVFRKGLKATGEKAKKTYKGWLDRPTNVNLGSLGIFGK